MIFSRHTRRTVWAFALALLLASPLTQALKPNYEADRLLMAAREAISADDYGQAERYLSEARQLGIALPPDYDFLYGKLLRRQKELVRARTHLEQYVDRAGSSGEYYREALALITDIEKARGGGSTPPAQRGNSQAEIRWADGGADYLKEIQSLYQIEDPAQALVQHINSLLKFYAYGDERVIAGSRLGTPSRHRILTSDRGEIISLSRIGADEEQPFTEDRFPVYGINPYIRYECSAATANCWLTHPVTAGRWLQIVNNEEIADELVRAFSQLIKGMQKRD